MKRKIALAMVLAMTASMAQPVLAADSKTTLDVIISQYGTQTQTWWTQFEKDFEAENPDIDLNVEIVSWNDLYTKVNTLVANNNAPDILNIDVLADYPCAGIPVAKAPDYHHPSFNARKSYPFILL